MMSVKESLQQHVLAVLKDLDIVGTAVAIAIPSDAKNGDYATNVAMVAFKTPQSSQIAKSPIELAIAIKMKLDALDIPFVSNIEVVPPGFINFRISDSYLLLQLPGLAKEPAAFAKGSGPLRRSSSEASEPRRKTVVVEYSSPNIAKPFTVGHLRSTIIGDAVANLLEATGLNVHRDNHLGDWGTQFGKQIYAIKQWGNEEEIEKSDRPVKELVDLYIKFHEESQKNPELEDKAREWFKKLEDGDPEARKLWQKCIDWSWKEFEGIYRELGVSFTENNGRGYGESYFEDKMKPVIEELEEKDLLKEGEEGAKLVFFEPFDSAQGELPPLMILKKDGSTLYATRDLATDKFRLEKYGKDILVINEVGVEQSLYFKQLYHLEELLGWYGKEQRVHIRHGHFRFKEGKMSTRKGNVIWLEDVLEEAEKRAADLASEVGVDQDGRVKDSHIVGGITKRAEISKKVGIGAIKWNDLKRDSKQDIVFDWDDILNMQGNSGPYMQYTYARTQSVLRKSPQPPFNKGGDESLPPLVKGVPKAGDLHPEERDLLRLLSQFGDVVGEAAERFAPSILCTYLFTLAQAFNLFYQKHQILKAEEEAKRVRLLLTTATGEVIKQGLGLLGIKAPEKM